MTHRPGLRGDVSNAAAPSPPPAQPDAGSHAPTDELPSLFPADEANAFLDRWGEVQSRFVDDPKRAVADGDVLVAEVMQTLAGSFARHKAELATLSEARTA